MINHALPDAATIEEVISRLSGRAPSGYEVEEFSQKLSDHDLTDPLAHTTFTFGSREYRAKGNRITSIQGLKEDQLVYIDRSGLLHDRTAHSFEKWMDAFQRIGWTAKEGVAGMYENRHPEQKHVLMRELTSFDRTDLPQPVLMAFPCLTPDGNPGTLSLRTFSLCDGTSGASRIVNAVHQARKIMPGGPEKARNLAVSCIEEIIKEIQSDLKHEMACMVTATDWHRVLVTFEGLDNLLEPTEEHLVLDMEQCRFKGIAPNYQDKAKLETSLKQHSNRIERGRKGGVTTSGLAALILQGEDPRKHTKWRSKFTNGLKTKTRITLRNGSIGGEIIVEKDNRRIFRLLNNTFELPGHSIPEGMVTAMIGRPLSSLIEHPFVTDKMIITKIASTSRRIEGKYQDNARTTS